MKFTLPNELAGVNSYEFIVQSDSWLNSVSVRVLPTLTRIPGQDRGGNFGIDSDC